MRLFACVAHSAACTIITLEFDFQQGRLLRDSVGDGPYRRKRRHAGDMRVGAQHQCVGDDGDNPLPCRDLIGVELGAAGGNRRERDD
jgi:hypothetical protein